MSRTFRFTRAVLAIVGVSVVIVSGAAAASTPIVLPKDFTIAEVDGRFIYATNDYASESDSRAELIRIDTTSNTTTLIYRADQPVSSINHVTARYGRVAFVTEVNLNGNVVSVPFVQESKLRLIRSDGAEPIVLQTITRRDSASGKPAASCGGEFAHTQLLTSNRIQTMVTMFGQKLGNGKCKAQSYSRSFGRDQRQRIRLLSFRGKPLRTLDLKMGQNIEQNGGIFSFNRDADQFAFPERTSFRALLTRNGSGRRIRVPNARSVESALALGGGAVLVDFKLKKKRGKFSRELRLFPNVYRSDRSVFVQSLRRHSMPPARCGFGWISENTDGSQVVAFNRQGKPVKSVYSDSELWIPDQPICDARKAILDRDMDGLTMVDLPRIP